VGFFGWDFIGNPACARSRRFMWRSTRSGQRSSSPHRVPCTLMGWNILKTKNRHLTCYMGTCPASIAKTYSLPIYDPDSAPDPETHYSCCGFGMFFPDPGSEFFHPGSRVKKLLDPVSGSASKDLSILKRKKNCL
jgi:hypothetical protein